MAATMPACVPPQRRKDAEINAEKTNARRVTASTWYILSAVMRKFVAFLLAVPVLFAQAPPLADLIDLARQGPAAPGLKERVAKTLGANGRSGVWGQDYIFVADSAAPVTVSLDNHPAVPMAQIEGSTKWMLLTKMR